MTISSLSQETNQNLDCGRTLTAQAAGFAATQGASDTNQNPRCSKPEGECVATLLVEAPLLERVASRLLLKIVPSIVRATLFVVR
jgi:hypothetical protein